MSVTLADAAKVELKTYTALDDKLSGLRAELSSLESTIAEYNNLLAQSTERLVELLPDHVEVKVAVQTEIVRLWVITKYNNSVGVTRHTPDYIFNA